MLCLDTGTNIELTLEWLKESIEATFEGQVAPICCPDTSIGPDVIYLLRNSDYTDFRACILQSKYVTERVDHSQALLTLVSTLLYHQKRGKSDESYSRMLTAPLREKWDAVKDSFISPKRPCLRIYVHTTESVPAKSGTVASDSKTPSESKTTKEGDQWFINLNNKRLADVFSDSACRCVEALKKKKKETKSG